MFNIEPFYPSIKRRGRGDCDLTAHGVKSGSSHTSIGQYPLRESFIGPFNQSSGFSPVVCSYLGLLPTLVDSRASDPASSHLTPRYLHVVATTHGGLCLIVPYEGANEALVLRQLKRHGCTLTSRLPCRI